VEDPDYSKASIVLALIKNPFPNIKNIILVFARSNIKHHIRVKHWKKEVYKNKESQIE
jgi:hypothetical protein